MKFGLHSTHVLLEGGLQEATIVISEGKISNIFTGEAPELEFVVEDLGDHVIMPGIIDPHVHINEPGRTEWEGFDTATKAAAAGGITTMIEMPLNSDPVTTTATAFRQKLASTKDKLHVNCGFWGGIVPGNTSDLEDLIKSGVFGIKAFLTHSGIEDFPNVSEEDLRAGMSLIRKQNVPLLVHAELESEVEGHKALVATPTNYFAYLNSRPKTWEDEAIKLIIELCLEFGTQVHIVHLSSANSLDQLESAISAGLPVSVETCPHYLFFNAEEIPNARTEFKCAPPIREKANNDQLWQGVKDGLFSFIASDHSPTIPDMKELQSGNLLKAWGGIASIQFSLPAFWTKAKERGISIARLSELMSKNVANFLNLHKQKGMIANGFDADFTIWDPEATFEVTSEMIEFKHKVTPYLGQHLSGKVIQTYVNGRKVYDTGTFAELSFGKVIMRNEQ